jgi:hypothetical protein
MPYNIFFNICEFGSIDRDIIFKARSVKLYIIKYYLLSGIVFIFLYNKHPYLYIIFFWLKSLYIIFIFKINNNEHTYIKRYQILNTSTNQYFILTWFLKS